MPKRNSFENKTLNNFINENNEFILEDNGVFCTVCNFSILYKPEKGIFNIKKHLSTEKHRKRLDHLNKKNNENTCFTVKEKEIQNRFDPVEFITQVNYSFNDLNNPAFITFAEKHFDFTIQSGSHYRNSVCLALYKIQFEKLQNLFHNQQFFITCDSTINAN